VALVRTDVSEKSIASVNKTKEIDELEVTLEVTSNRSTLHAQYIINIMLKANEIYSAVVVPL
jgi:endonuclease IV